MEYKPIPIEMTPEYQSTANWNVGRNVPCPCDSEKKYKKCCWDEVNLHCAKYHIRSSEI